MEKEKALTMWLPVIAAGVKDLPECKEALEMAIEALENQKIGHWIRQKGVYGLADTCECSVCGRTIYAGNENDLKDYPYCHCGAKMEGDN